MNITTAQVKEIRTEFAKLKPVKVTLDGNRSLTVKEAIFALAPTLERMKKRGFDTQEIAEKLHEKGIDVKPPTLAKYLNEFRRGKDRKKDTPPPPSALSSSLPKDTAPAPKPDRPATVSSGQFPVIPDTPLDEL
ncbi:hypothetical protein MASR1M90_12070 [Desulfovibrionales bacterium]